MSNLKQTYILLLSICVLAACFAPIKAEDDAVPVKTCWNLNGGSVTRKACTACNVNGTCRLCIAGWTPIMNHGCDKCTVEGCIKCNYNAPSQCTQCKKDLVVVKSGQYISACNPKPAPKAPEEEEGEKSKEANFSQIVSIVGVVFWLLIELF